MIGVKNQPPRTAVDNALRYAEASASSFGRARSKSQEGKESLDGYQGPVEQVRADRPSVSVAQHGRELQEQSYRATRGAEDSYSAQLQGLDESGAASYAIDQSWNQVPEHLHDELRTAQILLDQRDEASRTEYYLSSALATIHGGAAPYVDVVAQDTPHFVVSHYADPIASLLGDARFDLQTASRYGEITVKDVNHAVDLLRQVQAELRGS